MPISLSLPLALERPAAPAAASPRVLRVAAMFGLGADPARTVAIVPPVTLHLRAAQVVFITGPSGGGKSTVLRLIADALARHPEVRTLRLDDLPHPPDRAIVDCLATDARDDERGRDASSRRDATSPRNADPAAEPPGLARALELLSLAGLSDAFVLLRRPRELSDGQRARLRLAQAFDMVERDGSRPALTVILADEFGATLDRTTAHTIARAVRRWTRRSPAPVCFIAATTHDDLLEPLEPDVLIEKGLGDAIEIATREMIDQAPPPRAPRPFGAGNCVPGSDRERPCSEGLSDPTSRGERTISPPAARTTDRA